MTISAGNLIDRASQIAQDTANIRWTRPEWFDWLNDAQREVVTYKPDASSVLGAVPLIAGTLQAIPSGGIKFLGLTRNMGVTGTTPGRAITLIDRKRLDAQVPNWHGSNPKAVTLHYMPEPLTPTRYYVYPPAIGNTKAECLYSVIPALCVGEQSALSINEIYSNAVLNYMLFRAFSKDVEYAANAAAYYQLFANEVGIKGAADAAVAPKA